MSVTEQAQPLVYSSPANDVAPGGFWTQTGALLLDAYRDLQARKLFWITLVLSVIVSGAFAFVGINPKGITIFGKGFESAFNSNVIPPGEFFKFLFVELAIPFWFGFFATVLALVSVGGTFPDLISGGSIDLYLSKPISRVRLFLTKYVFGLLFTSLQVFVFSFVSFLVIGARGGLWEPRIFLAVPLVTLFFSYLFCACVLLGVMTRSTLASILLTMLLWAGVWAIHSADAILTTFAATADARVEMARKQIAFNDEFIQRGQKASSDVSQFVFQRDKQQQQLPEFEQSAHDIRFWQRLIYGVKAPLPKLNETIDLMGRWLLDSEPFQTAQRNSREQRQANMRARGNNPPPRDTESLERVAESPEAQARIHQEMSARKAVWIIGTSLGFESVVLALAAWVFCRRDY